MVLIDSNGFVNRFKLSGKLNDLEEEKSFWLIWRWRKNDDNGEDGMTQDSEQKHEINF